MGHDRIKNNLIKIKKKIPSHCCLIAVSKYVTDEEIKIAYDHGQRDFGENRVPELIDKATKLKELCPDIRWHMIGNIQSNKLKDLLTVPNLYAIHSVFKKKHLKILNSHCCSSVNIFFQVNSSKEDQKGGVDSVTEVQELISLVENRYLKFIGLMGMGSLSGSKEELRESFRELKNMADSLSLSVDSNEELKTSMGMSADFELAISEGSNFVRIGSAIFK